MPYRMDFHRNVLRWYQKEWPMRRIEHAFEASLGQVLPETWDATKSVDP